MSKDRFVVTETPLSGLRVLTRLPREDERGIFQRMYCAETFAAWGILPPLSQINLSTTHLAGAVRGLHFQYPPHAELKIVSCPRGSIFDVAVDVREGSPTYLRWYGEVLSADNHRAMVVPEGFAHGFQALLPDSDVLYFTTAPYVPEAQGGLRPDDPAVAIVWPRVLEQISEQDSAWPRVGAGFQPITGPRTP
jgi:dTDP-4-dehydrorhamnose 3,5-epimerase